MMMTLQWIYATPCNVFSYQLICFILIMLQLYWPRVTWVSANKIVIIIVCAMLTDASIQWYWGGAWHSPCYISLCLVWSLSSSLGTMPPVTRHWPVSDHHPPGNVTLITRVPSVDTGMGPEMRHQRRSLNGDYHYLCLIMNRIVCDDCLYKQ